VTSLTPIIRSPDFAPACAGVSFPGLLVDVDQLRGTPPPPAA
jgi:hypothetical protein